MGKLKNLLEQRAALWSQERAQLERLKTEGQSLIGDALTQYEERAKDIDKLDKEIEGIGKLQSAEQRNRQMEERLGRPVTEPERGGEQSAEQRNLQGVLAFRAALKGAGSREFGSISREERAAFQAGVAESGGYLVAPQQFQAELIKSVTDQTPLRGLARNIMLDSAESLGFPTLRTRAENFAWTSELGTGDEEDSIEFGKRELRPHPLAKRLKVSRKLIRASRMPIEQILIEEMRSVGLAYVLENAFMTGTGVQQALGLFTASTNGISTGRDVSTGNTTTAIGADGLIEAKYSLKSPYWNRPNTRWLFHRDAMKQIRKLKLSDNQYVWQPGITADMQPRILDVPYVISEFVPNTFTTGLYVGLIGDLNFYAVVEALSMTVQVLNELYAESNQVGYIFRMEIDGAPVLEEAFARVKLA